METLENKIWETRDLMRILDNLTDKLYMLKAEDVSEVKVVRVIKDNDNFKIFVKLTVKENLYIETISVNSLGNLNQVYYSNRLETTFKYLDLNEEALNKLENNILYELRQAKGMTKSGYRPLLEENETIDLDALVQRRLNELEEYVLDKLR